LSCHHSRGEKSESIFRREREEQKAISSCLIK
jgi:hypothetical protein